MQKNKKNRESSYLNGNTYLSNILSNQITNVFVWVTASSALFNFCLMGVAKLATKLVFLLYVMNFFLSLFAKYQFFIFALCTIIIIIKFFLFSTQDYEVQAKLSFSMFANYISTGIV